MNGIRKQRHKVVSDFMVKNYRNVSVDNIKLGRINLLIGPNGSGKSNFLRAMGFLAKIAQNEPKPNAGTTALYETLSQNGWNRMLNFEADSKEIDFSWVFYAGRKDPYQYRLKLHIGDKPTSQLDFYVASEYFAYMNAADEQHDGPYWFYKCHDEKPGYGSFTVNKGIKKLDVRNSEVAFLQLSELRDKDNGIDQSYRRVYAERMSDLSKFLSSFFCYSCSDFNLEHIKKPIKNTLSSFLYPDAGNLVNLIYKWSQEEPETLYEYRKMITPLFGEVHPVELYIDPIPQSSDSQLAIGIGRQRYIFDDLSDGTIRAMILAALLVDRNDRMSVCSIDEPEMNLHPEWQSRFSDWLLTSNASQQFFISSHSPEILDPLTPAFMKGDDIKLFVFSDTDPLVALSPDDISELYDKGFNIGDLYRAKAIEIGGWPK